MLSVVRWMIFLIVLFLQAGAFFEKEWLTWVGGMALCLFLTFQPHYIKNRWQRTPYFAFFLAFILIFLGSSFVGMKN